MRNKYLDSYKYYISYEFSEIKKAFITSIIFVCLGLILGLILSLSRNYSSVLFDINEPAVEFITGSVNIGKLFFKNLSICMLGSILIFILCLHKYSGWIGYLYVLYQATIQMIIIIATIKYSGVTALIRSILIYIPLNFAVLFLLTILFSFLYTKACKEYNYKQSYGMRFKNSSYWYYLIIIATLQILLYMLAYLILPLLFRGIYIISF